MRLELYTKDELCGSILRSANSLQTECAKAGAMEIASRARGTPRVANRLLRRVRDFAQVQSDGVITEKVARHALDRLEIDALGLDSTDRRLLTMLAQSYGGGPAGLETLAAAMGEEAVTLEDVCEPYLMQLGFLMRTPRGRMITPAACAHLGIALPNALSKNSEQQSLY